MFSDAIFTLAGAIFAGLIILHINSYNIIKKKTKAEAIQKLRIDSMIEIINGAKELRIAIDESSISMVDITKEMLAEIEEQNYSQINKIINEANDKFFKNSRESVNIINNFSFLMAKEYVINEEMSREYNIITKEFGIIKETVNEMMKSIDEVKNFKITQDNIKDIAETFIKLIDDKNNKITQFSVQIIMIYKIKLEKEQENLLGNFLKFINFFKLIDSLNFVFRNRKREAKLEEILKGMER